jgi:hypothetical protein
MMRIKLLTNGNTIVSSIFWDMVIIISFSMLTIYSHLLPFPLYVIEPMRICVLISVIFLRKPNIYFLASILPLISFFISGHPIFIKSLIMIIELNTNVFFIFVLLNKIKNPFFLILTSTVISKMIYYLLKYILFFYILNETIDISKERMIEQIGLTIILGFTYYLLLKLKNNKVR